MSAKLIQEPEPRSFGGMLRFFRGQTIDKGSGKPLSQEKLAIKISEKSGLNITRNIVNNWENEKAYLNPYLDRPLLTAIIVVLYTFHGIKTLAEANQLLTAGGFRELNLTEMTLVNPQWVKSVEAEAQQKSAHSPADVGNSTESKPISAAQQPYLQDPGAKPNSPAQPENRALNLLAETFFSILEKIPDWLLSSNQRGKKQEAVNNVVLTDPDCGNQAVDLKQQRLKISAAFGSYFTGLLEKEHSYFPMHGQIDLSLPPTASNLESFQQIYWSMEHSRGPEVLLIAAEGGMGKSTLAAKIIRCLYSNHAIDLLLGDSAKPQIVNPLTGEVTEQRAEYEDLDSFLRKVSTQLGLDYSPEESDHQEVIRKIKDRIEGRRTVLVMDNLETVHNGAELLNTFRGLAGRDTRILITTRSIAGITHQTPGVFLIRLNPIREESIAREFLRWHISTNLHAHHDLNKLLPDLEDKEKLQRLIHKTGGIPLLMQLVLSDIARSAWSRLETLPSLFGKELLNFLYRERWAELGAMPQHGQDTRALLFHIRKQSHQGRISYENLFQWGKTARGLASIDEPLQILQERFLIVNSDHKQGNFFLFPSLVDFLETQPESNSA